jgi:hypothetical protein
MSFDDTVGSKCVAISNDYPGALGDESFRYRPADASSATGD